MVVLYVDGVRVLLTFRMEENGLACVKSQRFSLRFGFREDTIIVDEDIFDVVTLDLAHTLVGFRIKMRTITCFGVFIPVVTMCMASLILRWLLLLSSSLLALPLPAPFKLLSHVM